MDSENQNQGPTGLSQALPGQKALLAKANPTIPPGLTRKNAIRLQWLRGNLRWKLDSSQRETYDLIVGQKFKRFYLNCGRRWGKTFLMAIIAIECALRTPNAVVKVVAPTAKLVRSTLRPIYNLIFEDCPKNLRPKWNTMDGEYRFPNGSVVSLAGCEDGSEENLRGAKADLVIFDECGFIKNLSYVARSILGPMLLTTGGMMIYASTPPPSAAHDSAKIYHELKARNQVVTRTVFDNPRLDPEKRDAFFDDERGMLSLENFKKSVSFRREYMAEFIVDSTRAVVPEWDADKEKECVGEHPAPPYYDRYVSADWGFRRDASGVLFGYYDFASGIIVIENEVLLFKERTERMAALIRGMEKETWPSNDVYLRFGDGAGMGAQVNEDMQLLHGMTFLNPRKDLKELQVNDLRIWVSQGRLRIHPRCKMLLYQLQTTVWDATRKEFERSSEGHGDLLDALIYLCRNVQREKNPYPNGWGKQKESFQVVPNPYAPKDNAGLEGAFLNIFPMSKRGIA
jgi:hypothetical protein